MKYIQILTLLMIFSILSYGQTKNKHQDCETLNMLLSNSEFLHHFQIKKNMVDTLIIVDTFGVFSKCQTKYNGTLQIKDSRPVEVEKGERSHKNFIGRSHLNLIVVQDVNCKGSIMNITLWQATDNATMEIAVKKKKKTRTIKVISSGVY
jgi:uncharacterized membrane protein